MLEKLTPNQRLFVAIALIFFFFTGYSFVVDAPQAPAPKEHNTSTTTASSPAITTTSAHTTPTTLSTPPPSGDTLSVLEAQHFTLKIDTLGRISSVVLRDKKHNDKNNHNSELIATSGAKPLFIRFNDDLLNQKAAQTPYITSLTHGKINDPLRITLTQDLGELNVTKELTFYADGHYDATIRLSQERQYFLYIGQHPKIIEQMMTVSGNMVYSKEGVSTIFEDGDVENQTILSDVEFASSFDQYYASIVYGFDPKTQVHVDRDIGNNPTTYLNGTQTFQFHGYVGPKEYKTLQSINPVLVNAIEYGWFTFIAAPIFKVLMWLHGMVGNWGWAIIALTILIRIFLFPLTHKGMVSMQKIKEIAPKVKDLQAKYKGDPARMNAAVMELYRKHNANPLGGCFPLLLQIPIFFAIYRVLLNAVELQGAEWILWLNDLSRMDPYFILPLLMGATMFYQQHITPSNFTDPLQEKVFKFLPVIFTFFFVTFPAGLVLYWLVNNLFSITQQYLVNQQFARAKALRHEAHVAEKHHETH